MKNTAYMMALAMLLASASYLLSVKPGAELIIRNGTFSFAATTPDTQWGEDGLPDYLAEGFITSQGTDGRWTVTAAYE